MNKNLPLLRQQKKTYKILIFFIVYDKQDIYRNAMGAIQNF